MMSHNNLMRLMRANSKARARLPLRVEASADEATIYLYDVIVDDEHDAEWFGGVYPEQFAKELNAISASVVHLRINSPGGSIFAARAMEAAIREHPARTIAHVDGCAASAASFVAIACDEVEMSNGSMFMIHKGWCCARGNADDLLATAALLEKLDGAIADTYARKTGKPTSELLDLMAAETWLTAQESLDVGLADRIVEPSGGKSATAWDLSAYARAPVAGAEDNESVAQDKERNVDGNNRERYERLARLHGDVRPADSRAA